MLRGGGGGRFTREVLRFLFYDRLIVVSDKISVYFFAQHRGMLTIPKSITYTLCHVHFMSRTRQ